MFIESQGRSFVTIRANDILRKCRVLELRSNDGNRLVAEILLSETTHQLTVSLFEQNLPVSVLDEFISKGRSMALEEES